MIAQLRATCRRLLEEGSVHAVIGYGDGRPVFITRPEDADRLVWNDRCYANLTMYLKRKEVRALGNLAIVVKACDERALVVLEKESQIDRSSLYVIGMACSGVGQPKCAHCEVRVPRFANEVIGEAASALPATDPTPVPSGWAFWKAELTRCVKCYACRQACPLCYCERCVADKNRPVRIETSPSPRGNLAWHITRAFHLAGRCVGCGECTRACPAGIPLGLLNRALAETVAAEFGSTGEPVFGTWSLQDKEDFIR